MDLRRGVECHFRKLILGFASMLLMVSANALIHLIFIIREAGADNHSSGETEVGLTGERGKFIIEIGIPITMPSLTV